VPTTSARLSTRPLAVLAIGRVAGQPLVCQATDGCLPKRARFGYDGARFAGNIREPRGRPGRLGHRRTNALPVAQSETRLVPDKGVTQKTSKKVILGRQSSHSGWVLDDNGIKFNDGSRNHYGAPSGEGVTVEIGRDGRAFFSGPITGRTLAPYKGPVRPLLVGLIGLFLAALAMTWTVAVLAPRFAPQSPVVVYVPSPSATHTAIPANGPASR
jgi:hypothetical protein